MAAAMRLRPSLTASSPSPVKWYMMPGTMLTSMVTVFTSSPFTAALYVFTSIVAMVNKVWFVMGGGAGATVFSSVLQQLLELAHELLRGDVAFYDFPVFQQYVRWYAVQSQCPDCLALEHQSIADGTPFHGVAFEE